MTGVWVEIGSGRVIWNVVEIEVRDVMVTNNEAGGMLGGDGDGITDSGTDDT